MNDSSSPEKNTFSSPSSFSICQIMSHFSLQLGHCFGQFSLILLLFLSPSIASPFAHSTPFPNSKANGGCPSEMMQKCAEPLQQLGISSGKNLVLLLLQLHSPNQLRKNCQAYATALPCFRKLVHRCGVPSQVEILRQMENAHHFLCSPFSGVEQSQLLAHRVCIGRVLGQMGSGGTTSGGNCVALGGEAEGKAEGEAEGEAEGKAEGEAALRGTPRNSTSPMAIVLFRCRERCLAGANGVSDSAKFGCLVRAWLSEQNLCLSEQLRAKCGREAAAFYTKMQRKIFHAQFPVICEQNERKRPTEEKGRRRGEQNEWKERGKKESDGTGGKVPSTFAVTQSTIFVTSKKRRKTVARLSEFRLNFSGTKKKGSSGATATTATTSKAMPFSPSRPSSTAAPFSSAPFTRPSPFPLPSSSPPPSLPIPIPPITSSSPASQSSPSSPDLPLFVHVPYPNNASSDRNHSELLAVHSVPFHFSSIVEPPLHKRNKFVEGGPVAEHSASAPPKEAQSELASSSSFSDPVRSSSSSARPAPYSSSSPPPLPPHYFSPFSPSSSARPAPYSSSSPPPLPPHYFSPVSSFPDSSSPHSSRLLLPPLIPFPSDPFPFSPSFWVNGFNPSPDHLQQDGPSRVFFFEVLPIDETIYNA